MPSAAIKHCLLECVRSAGEVLLSHFGRGQITTRKESAANVVCEADLAAERCIVERIRARFPDHGIVTEETGLAPGSSAFTWIVDPLDGTSNFVAGIPWFGVQIAVVRGAVPILAAIHLPVDDLLYFAEAGGGAWRNDQPLRIVSEERLDNVLCALGMDAGEDEISLQRNAALHARLCAAVRNIRTTNSVIDFCYTLEGRLGGFVNTSTRLWDIAPIALLLPEAGGRLSDLAGNPIQLDITADACARTFRVIGASEALHPALVAAARPAATGG